MHISMPQKALSGGDFAKFGTIARTFNGSRLVIHFSRIDQLPAAPLTNVALADGADAADGLTILANAQPRSTRQLFV